MFEEEKNRHFVDLFVLKKSSIIIMLTGISRGSNCSSVVEQGFLIQKVAGLNSCRLRTLLSFSSLNNVSLFLVRSLLDAAYLIFLTDIDP